MRVALLIVSSLCLLCAVILLILHFAIGLDIFWFSIPLACSAVLNVIYGVYALKIKKNINAKNSVDESVKK